MCVTIKISLCGECAKSLQDGYLFHIWETTCRQKGLYKRSFRMYIDCDTVDNSIRELEQKGFIVTTEVNESTIAMKPAKEYITFNGKEDGLFYCANPTEHLEVCND